MKKLPVAVQLYSVRGDLEKDFFGVLQQVSDMGYEGVEFAGFYGHSAKEVKAFLAKVHLKAVSSHTPLDGLLADTKGILDYHKELGCPFIAIPWLDEPRRPGTELWNQVVTQIRALGEASQKAGIQLLYHNHDFEFTKLGGRYALDLLYEAVPAPLLATEIDTCWAKVSGVDPAAYLRQYSGRSPVVHLKDYIKVGNASGKDLYALIDQAGKDSKTALVDRDAFDFRPLGLGMQDVPAILKAAGEAGSQWIVVEQDRSTERPALEAIKISREYLKSLGF
jgi:sugar phosphate isomerase/epimerase